MFSDPLFSISCPGSPQAWPEKPLSLGLTPDVTVWGHWLVSLGRASQSVVWGRLGIHRRFSRDQGPIQGVSTCARRGRNNYLFTNQY